MSLMDFPHKPKTPKELFTIVSYSVGDFQGHCECEDLSLEVQSTVKRTTYGAKVQITWEQKSHCNCQTAPNCDEHGHFLLQAATFRVRSDSTLEAFKRWLGFQYTFADFFSQKASDTESDSDYEQPLATKRAGKSAPMHV